MKKFLLPSLKALCLSIILLAAGCEGVDKPSEPSVKTQPASVLVFSKTAGYRHASIEKGIETIKSIAKSQGFKVVATEDASVFNEEYLTEHAAIVFLNTTGDVLNNAQQIAMERFIQAGGGFVGVHAAADTEWEGDWYWYRNLVGGVFKSHPDIPSNVQRAELEVVSKGHLATESLPERFALEDEWYNYRDVFEFKTDLLTVKESSYQGGEHGDYHAIAWYHDYDGGRAFYTGLGHTESTYADEHFVAHLAGGLLYAIGDNVVKDYSKVRPYDYQFERNILVDNLNEPITFDFLPDGRILIGERPGNVKLLNPVTGTFKDLGFTKDVAFLSVEEMGLIGLAVDPNFEKTSWVYINHTAFLENQDIVARLSRFTLENDRIDFTQGETILEYAVEKNCCHMGGDLAFTENGDLFISSGDNTNPHDQTGFTPLDYRKGLRKNDAARTAGNTHDLRGKIIRITPKPEGGYTIPEGNLFSQASDGRPEIYAMGTRNAFTIAYDAKTGDLFYGDVGPDAPENSPTRGPRGYDEINRITQAANMGWPWVIGNNYPYVGYNFETGESNDQSFDPQNLVNESPNNTGAKTVPPAHPPLIWYPYGPSEEFPEMGTGGRTAIVADVYRAEKYPEQTRLPKYYDGKLFIVEFMRNFVKAVSYDQNNGVHKIEPFAPHVDYTLPIDARFGPDGALYVLEYGSAWFKHNTDSQLSRIAYSPNAKPVLAEKNSTVAPEGHQVTGHQDPSSAEHAADKQDGDSAGHTVSEPAEHPGAALAKANGCTACHKLDAASVGPSFKSIAERYRDDDGALTYLVEKIGSGGGGTWGTGSMPPFAHVDEATRTQLAEYILAQ